MNRFFADVPLIPGQRLQFEGDEHRHIAVALRKPEGALIDVTNGRGQVARCRLESAGKKQSGALVLQVEDIPAPPERVLCLGMIRHRERFDWAVEKAVELGATRIWVVHMDHCEKDRINESRFQQLVIAALKQSLRAHLPEIRVYASLAAALQEANALAGVRVLAADETASAPFTAPAGAEGYAFIVGPEGGFSTAERALLQQNGIPGLLLGRNRLRAETAAVAVLARFAV